jgi:tripartite-type tricarboxylate transporter receptor subunit TctC
MIKHLHTRLLGRLMVALVAAAVGPLALAWTDKPVKMLVPAPAGAHPGRPAVCRYRATRGH